MGWACYETEAIVIDRSDVCEFSLKNDKVGELLIKGAGLGKGYLEEWK